MHAFCHYHRFPCRWLLQAGPEQLEDGELLVLSPDLAFFMEEEDVFRDSWYNQLQVELRLDPGYSSCSIELRAVLRANPPPEADGPLPAAECAAAVTSMVHAALLCGLRSEADFVALGAGSAQQSFCQAGRLAPALLDMLAAVQQPSFHSQAELRRHLVLALGQLGALVQACQRQLHAQDRSDQRQAQREQRRALQQLHLSGSDTDADEESDEEEGRVVVSGGLMELLLGESLEDEQGPAGRSDPGCKPATGWWGLWGLLGCGSQALGPPPGGCGTCPALLEACVLVLGPLLGLGLLHYVPSGAAVPAQLLANLGRLLRCGVQRLLGQPAATADGLLCSCCWRRKALELVQSVCSCLAALDADSQLAALETVHVLPAICALLGRAQAPEVGLELLALLASPQPDAQQLVLEQPGLLEGLVAQLRLPLDGGTARSCCELLRLLVQDNAGMQLEVARSGSGAAAALAQLLGSEDSDVANEAAETLAVLQRGGGEAERLVREAGRGVALVLGG
jgi:hypothetical protein